MENDKMENPFTNEEYAQAIHEIESERSENCFGRKMYEYSNRISITEIEERIIESRKGLH